MRDITYKRTQPLTVCATARMYSETLNRIFLVPCCAEWKTRKLARSDRDLRRIVISREHFRLVARESREISAINIPLLSHAKTIRKCTLPLIFCSRDTLEENLTHFRFIATYRIKFIDFDNFLFIFWGGFPLSIHIRVHASESQSKPLFIAFFATDRIYNSNRIFQTFLGTDASQQRPTD